MSSYQKFLAALTPYSLSVSLLYLFGFWSSFDINVLEYIAISDVLKSALSPLLYALLLVAVGVALGNLFSTPINKYMPPGGGKHLPEAKYYRALIFVTLLMLFVAIFYIIFFETGGARWFKVAALSMMFLPIVIGDASFAEGYLKHKQSRVIIINILASLSLYSFGWGASNAKVIKSEGKVVSINGVETELVYIGWAGDFLFLWDDKKNMVVARNKSTVHSIEKKLKENKPLISFLYSENKK
ncbi:MULTISPECIES: hypothetical protein [Vibrio]|uniref:hypothetical protein n=1 Tax=Vibrio TaxID=662 RepID=UPI00107F1540|nr:hypothetical protein [Vibrio tasmaniensis]